MRSYGVKDKREKKINKRTEANIQHVCFVHSSRFKNKIKLNKNKIKNSIQCEFRITAILF